MPGSKQACPNSAACWSPATPAIGIACPAKKLPARVAEDAAGGHYRGQNGDGYVQSVQ